MRAEWILPLSPDGVVMELRNGGRMRVRPIRETDTDNLIAAYETLSRESRYNRFFTAPEHLSRPMAERLTHIDHENHFAWLVFDADAEGDSPAAGFGVAAARLIRDAEPTSAEAAVTVLDDYHHRGIGRFLIELLVCTAADVGVEVVRFEVLRENHKMRRLMDGTGAPVHRIPAEPGVVEYLLAVPPAETLSVAAGSVYRLLRHVAMDVTDQSPDRS